ncbi:MAG: protein jag, partial [Clostridiales Family XIII bacterium]|nr:protein jag [Clostridiales Family XIII bacterium]
GGRSGGRNAEETRNAPREVRVYDVMEEDYDDEDLTDFTFSDKPSLSERPENLTEVDATEASLFLREVIANMKLDVSIKTFLNDECNFIEISGADAKTVIGKRGQTLDSIQYLTNLVANKKKDEYLRVIIDVEGYRTRREKTLERLAVKLAKKVQKSGRSLRLEPMNPYERKVIHSTLQNIEGVSTRSEGEEPYRRVIIEKK